MKFKQAYKFQMSEILAPIKVYLILIASLEVFLIILSMIFKGSMEVNSFDFSMALFVLIVGACMFRGSFNFFSAHGVSRKTMLLSCFVVFATAAGIMVAFDIINSTVMILGNFFEKQYITSFDLMFYYSSSQDGCSIHGDYINTITYLPTFGEKVIRALVNIAFNYISYICLMIFGYFTSILFYRLPLKIKLIVFIGVPVLLLNALPILSISNIKPIDDFFSFISENVFKNPTGFIITELITIAVFGFFAYKIASKASLKTMRS